MSPRHKRNLIYWIKETNGPFWTGMAMIAVGAMIPNWLVIAVGGMVCYAATDAPPSK